MTDARWPGWPFQSTDPRVVPQPAEQQEADEVRECNDCNWTGPRSECCWLGAIGPLCPECRETTEAA